MRMLTQPWEALASQTWVYAMAHSGVLAPVAVFVPSKVLSRYPKKMTCTTRN